MKVLIVDQGSVGGGLAMRMARDGHKVLWYIEPKKSDGEAVADNFHTMNGKDLHPNITKVLEWIPHASKSDLILATENGSLLQQLNRFRRQGVAVYAPSQECADMEINRGNGLKWMEKRGLPIPPYEVFKTLKDAEKYVMKTEQAYVFKTAGDNENKALSYVPKTPAQLVQQLRTWQRQGMNNTGDVLLQTKIEDILCEMSVSSYLGPNGFNGPFIHCFEHKKLMNGEIGPNTGEQGSLMMASAKSKLASKVLAPLEEDLIGMDSFCNFDINCIIDEKGEPWVLEATSRFGYPATNIELELWNGDVVEQLYDVCQGIDNIDMSTDWAMGVVLTIPDYPYQAFDKDQVCGIPIYGVTEKNEEHIHPQSVMVTEVMDDGMKEVPTWVTCGNYVAVVTGKGETIKKAQKQTYGVVDELSISNMMYRTDIGDKIIEVLPQLTEFGYLNKKSQEK